MRPASSISSIISLLDKAQWPTKKELSQQHKQQRLFLQNIKNQKHVKDIYNLLEKWLLDGSGKIKFFPDIYCISYLIKKLGLLSCLNECKLLFQLALKLQLTNRITYNIMIDTAGKNGDLEFAKQVFKEAKDLGLANNITYNTMINAAGKNGDLEFAKQVFKEAKDLGLADNITYTSILEAAGENGDLEFAKQVFKEANNLNDPIITATMIDNLFKLGERKSANLLFKNSHHFSAYIKPINKKDKYDFHGLNYGTAYLAMTRIFQNKARQPTITLIIGKGLHSHVAPTEIHPVKRAVLDFINYSKHLRISYSFNNGGGCIIINCPLPTKRFVLNTKKHHRFFTDSIKPKVAPASHLEISQAKVQAGTSSS